MFVKKAPRTVVTPTKIGPPIRYPCAGSMSHQRRSYGLCYLEGWPYFVTRSSNLNTWQQNIRHSKNKDHHRCLVLLKLPNQIFHCIMYIAASNPWQNCWIRMWTTIAVYSIAPFIISALLWKFRQKTLVCSSFMLQGDKLLTDRQTQIPTPTLRENSFEYREKG